MSSLVLSFIALSLVALLFICIPLFRFNTIGQNNQSTASWYKQRVRELEGEYAKGQYSEQEYQVAITELKLTTQQELTSDNRQLTDLSNEFSWQKRIAVAILFFVSVLAFYVVQGNFTKLSNWQESVNALPELTDKILKNEDSAATVKELQDFALGLRTKLAAKDEAIGWMLLGRTLLALNDIDSAISAFQKAYEREPQSVTNIVNYAQSLYLKGEDYELKKSVRLLREALRIKPDNLIALILFGESSLLLERMDNAQQAFELALTMVPNEDYRKDALQQRLEFIKMRLGDPQSDTAASSGIRIIVTLDEKVPADLSEFKYLFLFAKSTNSPVPVAVKKLAVTSFPLELDLTDADTMLPDVKLSTQQVVNITARLSKDEVAALSPGEWQGEILDVSPSDETQQTIIINKGTK